MQSTSCPSAPSCHLKDYLLNEEVLITSCSCGHIGSLLCYAVSALPKAAPIGFVSFCTASAIGLAMEQRNIVRHDYETKLLLISNKELKRELKEKLERLSVRQCATFLGCKKNREAIADLKKLIKGNDEALYKKLERISSKQTVNNHTCTMNSEKMEGLHELINNMSTVITEQPGVLNQLPTDCHRQKNR
ncbi:MULTISPECIES: hypothetical protein [Gammaproteobacteria]|uniref:hypothetical protein n=1 Tax=Gammaproteobacteria TaxID=1236 RepID=UPI001ADAD19E|nr:MULTISPECIES: hypothetical protein [Gammaproteobacteria]MBO9479956.1 hypothetical protein [Salinisphaera sp. G21_0]MBO9492547.1 hypothetical protein [Thalassotalea sp. G20_0]